MFRSQAIEQNTNANLTDSWPASSVRIGNVQPEDPTPVAQASCPNTCYICSDGNPCMFHWGHLGDHQCNRGHRF
jgi:hypothetical protein